MSRWLHNVVHETSLPLLRDLVAHALAWSPAHGPLRERFLAAGPDTQFSGTPLELATLFQMGAAVWSAHKAATIFEGRYDLMPQASHKLCELLGSLTPPRPR